MIVAAILVALVTGFGWVLRGARWSRRGRPRHIPLAAAGLVQDAAVGLWIGAIAVGIGRFGGLAAAFAVLIVGGGVGVAMWADHLLSLWIGVRLQPHAFGGANDLRNVWTSVCDLNLTDFALGALGALASALVVAMLFLAAPAPVALAIPLAIGATVATGVGVGLGRSSGQDHVVFLIARPTPLSAAVRGATVPEMPPMGDDPRFPLWRRHVPLEPARGRKPHVLVILLESFAAQHVGMCGGRWGATPQLDAWAARGLACPDAYGNGVQTVRALLSTLFGIPPRLSVRPMTLASAPPRLYGLPQILGDRGWHTAFWHGGDSAFHGQGPFLQSHGVAEVVGEAEVRAAVEDAAAFGSFGVHDEALFTFARRRLRRLTEDDTPTLGVVLTLSHHHPWSSPPGWPTHVFDGAQGRLAGFLDSLAYADDCLGAFLRGLEEDGVLDHTAVVLVGDHGVPTGSGGESFDHFAHLADRGMRVPMAIIAPGRVGASVIDEPTSQLDLLPTILDVLGVEANHHSLGASLLRPLPSRVIPLSNPFGGGWLGVRRARHKLVVRPDRRVAALYDLSVDPGEQSDLSADLPELHETLSRECLHVHGAMERLYATNRLVPPVLP